MNAMPSAPSPQDVTGRKRAELQRQHQDEIQRREKELGMVAQAEARRLNEVVDLTGQRPRAVPDPVEQPGPYTVANEEAAPFRAAGRANLPLGATVQPGMPGVAIDANGILTDTGQPGYAKKTNATSVTGTGAETPFPVVGGTVADQRTRGVVDTRNATNVGAAGGPDVEAPRVWGGRRQPDAEGYYDPSAPDYEEGDVALEADQPVVTIRVNTTLENVTIGAGTDYTFEEGGWYKVEKHVADHLEEKGYLWH